MMIANERDKASLKAFGFLSDRDMVYYFDVAVGCLDLIEGPEMTQGITEDLKWAALLGLMMHSKRQSNLALKLPKVPLIDIAQAFDSPLEEVYPYMELLGSYFQSNRKDSILHQVNFRYLSEFDEGLEIVCYEFEFILSNSCNQDRVESLLQACIQLINIDLDIEDQIDYSVVSRTGDLLSVQIEAMESAIDCLTDLFEEQPLEVRSTLEIDCFENRYNPPTHYKTMIEQHLLMDMDNRNFGSEEELMSFVEAWNKKSLEERLSQSDLSEATVTKLRTLDLYQSRRIVAVPELEQMLDQENDSMEALLCLAGWLEESAARLELIEKALELGEHQLDCDALDEHAGWWFQVDSRPYIRALLLAGVEYIELGDAASGQDMLEEVLELTPTDPVGARYTLLALGIQKSDWGLVGRLLRAFSTEESLLFHYGKAIHSFFIRGRKSKSRRLLLNAFKYNLGPMQLLLGDHEFDVEDMLEIRESEQLLQALTPHLVRDSGFVNWLIEIYLASPYAPKDEPKANFLDMNNISLN